MAMQRQLTLLAALAFAFVTASEDPCNHAYISEMMDEDFYTGEERVADGEVDLESSDLEVMHDNGFLQVIAVQIVGLQIPPKVRITSAQLVFEVEDEDVDSGEVQVEIRAERSSETAFLSAANHDISSRPTTNSYVRWSPPAGLDEKDLVYTPDLSSVVQEVVDLSDWGYGHAITFIITHVSGDGVRMFESGSGIELGGVEFEGPVLKVTWADLSAECDLPPLPPSPPSPACVPSAGAQYNLNLNSPLTSLSANNFGGKGPGVGENDPKYIQYDNVGVKTSTYGVNTAFHLRIESTSEYADNDETATNGLRGLFGHIIVSVGRTVDMRFSFIDSSYNPVTLDEPFDFVVYDLDAHRSGGELTYDEVSVCDSSGYSLDQDTVLSVSDDAGCTRVSSPVADVNANPAPFHPRVGVPALQKKHSVTFHFEGISEFSLSFSATWENTTLPPDDDDHKSFSFSFSGQSAPSIECATCSVFLWYIIPMIIAWLVLWPLGVATDRYANKLNGRARPSSFGASLVYPLLRSGVTVQPDVDQQVGRSYNRALGRSEQKKWRCFHIVAQLFVLFLTLLSVALHAVSTVDTFTSAFAVLGLVLVILTALQLLIAFLIASLVAVKPKLSRFEEDVKTLFQLMDYDSSGQITIIELVKAMKWMGLNIQDGDKWIEVMFLALPLEEGGTGKGKEPENISGQSPEEVLKMVNELAFVEGGQMNLEEFTAWLKIVTASFRESTYNQGIAMLKEHLRKEHESTKLSSHPSPPPSPPSSPPPKVDSQLSATTSRREWTLALLGWGMAGLAWSTCVTGALRTDNVCVSAPATFTTTLALALAWVLVFAVLEIRSCCAARQTVPGAVGSGAAV